MLLKPTEKKHIPFGYDKAIATMLNSLDFETQYSDAWIEKYGKPSKRVMDLRDLREQYAKIVASDTTEIEANEYMLMMIESLAIKTEGMRLSELDTRTLSEVRTLVAAIKFQISHINQAFTDDIQRTISELGDATIEYFNGLKDQTISGGAVGRAPESIRGDRQGRGYSHQEHPAVDRLHQRDQEEIRQEGIRHMERREGRGSNFRFKQREQHRAYTGSSNEFVRTEQA